MPRSREPAAKSFANSTICCTRSYWRPHRANRQTDGSPSERLYKRIGHVGRMSENLAPFVFVEQLDRGSVALVSERLEFIPEPRHISRIGPTEGKRLEPRMR